MSVFSFDEKQVRSIELFSIVKPRLEEHLKVFGANCKFTNDEGRKTAKAAYRDFNLGIDGRIEYDAGTDYFGSRMQDGDYCNFTLKKRQQTDNDEFTKVLSDYGKKTNNHWLILPRFFGQMVKVIG